jgi:DNA-binding MarR family transcriptional regulator
VSPSPERGGTRTAAAGAAPREQFLTAPALRVLAVLADGSGGTPLSAHGLSARSGIRRDTVRDIARRLAAAGWTEAVPGAAAAGGERAGIRLTAVGRAEARRVLDAARGPIALARAALAPSSGPIPVPAASRVTGIDLCAALIFRAFPGTPARPCSYAELAARTGAAGTTFQTAMARMRKAGWVADDPRPPARALGRRPSLVALTPAGRSAAPAVLAAARSQLEDLAVSLDKPGRWRAGKRPGEPDHAAAGAVGRALGQLDDNLSTGAERGHLAAAQAAFCAGDITRASDFLARFASSLADRGGHAGLAAWAGRMFRRAHAGRGDQDQVYLLNSTTGRITRLDRGPGPARRGTFPESGRVPRAGRAGPRAGAFAGPQGPVPEPG